MKIGLDIMGGDYAPKANVLGAIEAHQVLTPDQHLVLIGDTKQIKPLLSDVGFNPDHFEYVHTDLVGSTDSSASIGIDSCRCTAC